MRVRSAAQPTRARGAEFVILGLARSDYSACIYSAAGCAAVEGRPVQIAFQAKENFTDRVVEAESAAEKKTVCVEYAGRDAA